MRKAYIERLIKLSLLGVFTTGIAMAADVVERRKEKQSGGLRYMPGYTPPTEPDKHSLVVEEEGPLEFDPVRKMYFRKKIKRGSDSSSQSGGSDNAAAAAVPRKADEK